MKNYHHFDYDKTTVLRAWVIENKTYWCALDVSRALRVKTVGELLNVHCPYCTIEYLKASRSKRDSKFIAESDVWAAIRSLNNKHGKTLSTWLKKNSPFPSPQVDSIDELKRMVERSGLTAGQVNKLNQLEGMLDNAEAFIDQAQRLLETIGELIDEETARMYAERSDE